MAIDMKRFIGRFVDEARGHIEQLELGVRQLETAPAEQETINMIFRSAHTIKGSARMLKLLTISETAHKLEDVLGALREERIVFSAELGTVLLRAIDAIADLIDKAEQDDLMPDVDTALCALLADAAEGRLSTDASAADGKNTNIPGEPTLSVQDQTEFQYESLPNHAEVVLKTGDSVRIRLAKLDELIQLVGEVVSSHVLLNQCLFDLKHLTSKLNATAHWDGLQVNLNTFEKNLSGNVLAQQLLMQELHDKALVLRMLPLAIVFDPATRLVRELARSVGKDVNCIVKGSEIELDRQIIDRLSDPVVHLLRNAIDHGIEVPELRQAAGKPKQGQIELSAYQDGHWVVVVVRDDGGGLPLEGIRKKAIARGILSEQQMEALTEKEIMELIFLPGFSTHAIITDLSGRGVGMDVVKKIVVDELQGVIDITSDTKGTAFLLKLPLSLALMRVLLCEAGGMPFGFTAQYIFTLVRVSSDKLMTVAQRQAVIIGNEFIPVVDLAELLEINEAPKPSDTLLLVIVKTHAEKLALIIDRLVDECDMVIKPLPEHMRKLPWVTGMVMTGRNEWVSILNVPQLLKATTKMRLTSAASAETENFAETVQHILVVDDSLNTREIEKDVLEAHGYRVTTAEDGIDGWHKACAETFDAILTDVEMPGMDGFSFTRKLRQDQRFQHTPIIIVTSREKEEDKRRGIEVGADAYIVKGDFEQSNLVSTLRNLLG